MALMKTFLTDVCDFLFPRACCICGNSLLHDEKYCCTSCLMALPRTNLHLIEDNEIEKNFWGKINIKRATSFLYYSKGGDVRQLLYELKYHGNKYIGEFLGRVMASELIDSGFFDGIDCIIPVPLHKKKLHKRGYNQSEWLCKGISQVTSIPIRKDIIRRVSQTETQTHKGMYERWSNVNQAFQGEDVSSLNNLHILIVDDVLTTGATIVSCCDSFKDIKSIQISVLTLAIATE